LCSRCTRRPAVLGAEPRWCCMQGQRVEPEALWRGLLWLQTSAPVPGCSPPWRRPICQLHRPAATLRLAARPWHRSARLPRTAGRQAGLPISRQSGSTRLRAEHEPPWAVQRDLGGPTDWLSERGVSPSCRTWLFTFVLGQSATAAVESGRLHRQLSGLAACLGQVCRCGTFSAARCRGGRRGAATLRLAWVLDSEPVPWPKRGRLRPNPCVLSAGNSPAHPGSGSIKGRAEWLRSSEALGG